MLGRLIHESATPTRPLLVANSTLLAFVILIDSVSYLLCFFTATPHELFRVRSSVDVGHRFDRRLCFIYCMVVGRVRFAANVQKMKGTMSSSRPYEHLERMYR